jgi:nitrite reductase (NADH) small subunit
MDIIAPQPVETVWTEIGALADIPKLGARIVTTADGDIAVFRTADDEVFALWDRCPHKNGPLSQGIVHGRSVTCPLHGWVLGLETGDAQAPDVGCAHTVPVQHVGDRIRLALRRRS